MTHFRLQPRASSINSIPELNADVLEHIFGYLKLKDLYAVAQCSHQFEECAQLAFQSGICDRRYSTRNLPPHDSDSVQRHAGFLRVFGKYIRYFDCRIVPMILVNNPKIWTFLEPSQLKTMYTTMTSIHAYVKQPRAQQFLQLEKLVLMDFHDYSLRINFKRWCPNLKILDVYDYQMFFIRESWMPCNLDAFIMRYPAIVEHKKLYERKLKQIIQHNPKINEIVILQNFSLKLLTDIGSHLKLLKLRCLIESLEIEPYLGQFKRLEHLWVESRAESIPKLATVIRTLPNLKTFTYVMHSGTNDSSIERFLYLLGADALPRNLNFILLSGNSGKPIRDFILKRLGEAAHYRVAGPLVAVWLDGTDVWDDVWVDVDIFEASSGEEDDSDDGSENE